MEEVRFKIENLSELEYKLVINALKVWRGDFGEFVNTKIWTLELDGLLEKLGFAEKGWQKVYYELKDCKEAIYNSLSKEKINGYHLKGG